MTFRLRKYKPSVAIRVILQVEAGWNVSPVAFLLTNIMQKKRQTAAVAQVKENVAYEIFLLTRNLGVN